MKQTPQEMAEAYGQSVYVVYSAARQKMIKAFIAGFNAVTSQQGLRWVKASERLPINPGSPQNHWRIDGFHKVNGNFFDGENGEVVFAVLGNGCHDDYFIEKDKFDRIEYLDETSDEISTLTAGFNAAQLPPHVFFIDEIKDLLKKWHEKELSVSKLTEILNEKATPDYQRKAMDEYTTIKQLTAEREKYKALAGTAKASLEVALDALKWMWDNMRVSDPKRQSDAFNTPANAINDVEQTIEQLKAQP